MNQEALAALCLRINDLQFPEYAATGWLKAVPLNVEQLGKNTSIVEREKLPTLLARPPQLPPPRTGWFRRFLAGSRGKQHRQRPTSAQKLIAFFLQEWLYAECPESIGAHGLDVSLFREASRDNAIQTVDSIVTTSLEDAQRRQAEAADDLWPHDEPTPEDAIDYPQLREWFVHDLFGDSDAEFFLHNSPGGATVRFNVAKPRVIGLTAHVIGMFWLE